ncbi:secondary thiamine-phosphate synthase enzyme YjbQ [Phycisphaeraceae bacterium D3-23]
MNRLTFDTQQHNQMVEITHAVREAIQEDGVMDGWVEVFVPHTTAGITINENADPDVVHDMLKRLEKMVPWNEDFDKHGEGNSAAHVKASMMGSSVRVKVRNRDMQLGRWQGIWLCEFDGPRARQVWVEAGPKVDRS